MADDRDIALPEFDDSSIAAVHLLQGVVYQDEERIWDLVLDYRSRLDTYFGRIGLRLVIDEAEGFAFLRQLDDSELENVRGYDLLPKLFRKKRLSYDATLACVLFREELRRFEETGTWLIGAIKADMSVFVHGLAKLDYGKVRRAVSRRGLNWATLGLVALGKNGIAENFP
jgi:hypothetical protein